MKNELKIQEDYWDRQSGEFEKIYNHKKSSLWAILDRIFRKDMYQRYIFTLENCEPVENRAFLDVGCGNGLYSIELARRGAGRVVGIDISSIMLAKSVSYAEQEKVDDTCSFVQTDVLNWETDDRFDVSFGIGLFDYIREPLPVLTRMRELTTDKTIASFPRFWTWRAPVRKTRLWLRGCPVYFFRRQQVESFFAEAGYSRTEIRTVGKLFCAIGHC